MKVVYDLEAYSFSPHGGVARIFDEILPRLEERPGFDAVLRRNGPLARRAPGGDRSKMSPIPALPPGYHRHRWLGSLYSRMEQLYWRLEGADIFHPTFYPIQDGPRGAPVLVNVYDLNHELIPQADDMPDHGAFLLRKKRWLQRAERILCISEATRSDLLRCYDVQPGRVRVVHLAGNPSFHLLPRNEALKAASSLLTGVDRPFLLYVGSRQRYKNFHRLLQAYGSWSRRNEVALVVVGGRPSVEDAKLLDLCGNPPNVHYVGHATDGQLNALYNVAEFFVYPSAGEGFGIPLLEAMSAGCPLCLSDLPVFHEVAGAAADYFDAAQPDSAHAAFERSLQRRAAPDFARNPPKPAQDFSWDRAADEVWKIYEEMKE